MSKHSTWLRSAFSTAFILLFSFVFLLAGCSNNYSAPLAPAASVSPSTLTFSAISQGTTSSPSTITVTDSGNAALSISSVSFGGANVADFTNSSACSGSVSPAGSCTISVTFAPKHSGSLSESVTINDNDKDSPQVVTVSGTANAIVLSVTPPATAMGVGQTAQFMASGDPNGVTWSVSALPFQGSLGAAVTAGTIDVNGNYTPPAGAASFYATVTATSKTDATKTATATVNVVAPGVFANTNNVQVAQYSVIPPSSAKVSVQFGLDTTYGLNTWTQPNSPLGSPVSLYVAGMKQSTPYHMRGVIQFADGTSFNDADSTFTTGALPASLVPTITAATTPGETPQPGLELLDLLTTNPATTLSESAVTDLAGNVLWAYQPTLTNEPGPNPVKLLPNGHFLMVYSDQPDGADTVVQEVDLGSNLIWQLNTAQINTSLATATCGECNMTVNGLHHDFQVLSNGHLIVLASLTKTLTDGTTPTGDAVIDLGDMENVGGNNPNHTPQPVWAWNEFNHLDTNRRPYSYPDWTHTNAVIYSKDDGNLIISIRHQNWLVKIDYNNGAGAGDILWKLGAILPGDTGSDVADFTLLNPDGSTDSTETDWFFAQHGPSFTTTNTTGQFGLTLFDNGDDRGAAVVAGGTCNVAGQPACYSTVPVFTINEAAKTATLNFHPTTAGYSNFGGNAEVLANGDIEYDECAGATIIEITQNPTSQTVWTTQVTGHYAYRGMRIPSLYPGVQW